MGSLSNVDKSTGRLLLGLSTAIIAAFGLAAYQSATGNIALFSSLPPLLEPNCHSAFNSQRTNRGCYSLLAVAISTAPALLYGMIGSLLLNRNSA